MSTAVERATTFVREFNTSAGDRGTLGFLALIALPVLPLLVVCWLVGWCVQRAVHVSGWVR